MKNSMLKAVWFTLFSLRRASRFFKLNRKKEAIGLVVNSFDKGGLEQVVLNLYYNYRKQGYETYILVQNNEVGYFASLLVDARHIRILCSNKYDLIRYCWKKNINVLHYHYNTLGIKAAKALGIKTIYTVHNVYTWMNDEQIMCLIKDLKNADNIVAVSSYVKEYFCRRTQLPQNKVKVIGNGVDFKALDECQESPVTRESLGIKKDEVVFVNIASFHRVKHHANMIGAIESAIKKNKKIRLLFVGNIGDQIYYNTINEMMAGSEAKNNIMNIPYLERKHIGCFLRKVADVFILPSLQEGCSNAVFEAFYCGVPMILTKVGNAEDIINHLAGIVIDPAYSDILELNSTTIEALSNKKLNSNTNQLCSAMIEIAGKLGTYKEEALKRASFSSNFNAEEMAAKYLRLMYRNSGLTIAFFLALVQDSGNIF